MGLQEKISPALCSENECSIQGVTGSSHDANLNYFCLELHCSSKYLQVGYQCLEGFWLVRFEIFWYMETNLDTVTQIFSEVLCQSKSRVY